MSKVMQTWKSIMARKDGTADDIDVPETVQGQIDRAVAGTEAIAHEAYPDSLPGRLYIYKQHATSLAAAEAEVAGEKFNPSLFAKYFHQYVGVQMREENILPTPRYKHADIVADAYASAAAGIEGYTPTEWE